MDKSAANKKKSPAGTTRRAYSIFGGIINLTQQQQQQSHITKSNVLASSPGNVGGGGGGGGGAGASAGSSGKCSSVVGGGTSQDPQGSSSNVYTVTVTNSQTPDNTNQVKTYENLVPMVVVRKKKSDQSTSTVSSLTTQSAAASSNSSGMSKNNSNGGSGPIGPAPRTLSILTALNELAISDEIKPNPACSSLTAATTPPSSTSCNNRSNNTVGINNVSGTISKFNPTHSSCHYPGKRSSFGGNILQQHQYHHHQYESPSTNIASSTSSASLHHPPHHLHYQYTLPNNAAAATTSVYHSTSTQSSSGGLYATTSTSSAASNSQGYSEQVQPSYGNISVPTPSSSTFPSALGLVRRTGNKSQGSHKESSTRRKGGAVAAVNRQRDRSKSRTPDWIWKIFQLTKHGKLEELQQSLLGLDSTLIRHLADAKGNTVLHCAARGGHVNTLQWLVSVLGSQCTEAALNDHNQAGRTVILTALKKGQLDCLQWLVHQTKNGEKALVPNEGERSLLHYAVSYGNVNVVRWLCSELIDKGICVDIRDAGGMTPLHDAAKSGNVTVCHELILAGADPLSQTELGWRPSDLAIRHRHLECASYFMVAEAAGSLGNQLHSMLFAFNQLRQEHEDLRSHFRETLRVGKWLAKERNDLIKHFPSKWSQDSGTSPSSCALLLGGTNNGGRFSDLEHKLVVAEQAWKKISQSTDDTNEQILNGEEQSFASNVSSHDFLNRRLAAIQLRHERNQSLGNSLLNSGSSDEDPYAQEQGESSSSSEDDDDHASSSDVDAERITSVVTAGSDGGGMMGQNSSAIIHSSTNVSPSQKKNSSSSSAMRTRSTITTATTTTKAAPWLLPPNDAFLSQLSPFVGAHVGKKKSLPTLDLLVHGAPTSSSLLSPIVTQSSPSASSAFMQQQPTATTATATDTAGKNEKSSVQMDIELHHYAHLGSSSNHAAMGKRDSTSLDISVLEVIEPTSSHPTATSHSLATSASSPSKKNIHQAPDLICGTQNCKPLPRHRVDGHHPHRRMSQPQQHHSSQSLSLRESRQRRGYYSQSEENLLMGQQADALYEPISSPPLSFMRGDYHRQRRNMESKSETIQKYNLSPNDSSPPRLGNASLTKSVDTLDTVTSVKGESSREESRCKGGNEEQLPRPSSSLSVSLSAYKMCAGAGSVGCDSGSVTLDHVEAAGKDNFSSSSYASATNGAGSIGNSRRIISKSRTPSPKSYVTKLTVIPVETTSETCFLTVGSTSFDHQEEQVQSGGTRVAGEESLHQLHRLPGEHSEELSSLGLLSSCHIPNDSVSSSNTPVMPRFNSSGTVVFPSRKPCSSDWHSSSAELLSLTTPDSSLAGRLSPTPSENSRTESAFAPPASYVSHASQNSELSKTESARGQNTENEVSIEEEGEITNRDLGNISLSLPLVVNVQSSFINHTSADNTHSSFQTIHPSQLTSATSSSASLPQSFPSQNTKYSSTSSDNMAMMLDKTEKENLVIAQGSFEMGKSDRKKNRDCSSATATKDPYARDDGYDHEATNTAFADDSGNHDGDNDRSAIKQTSLFERKKQQHQQRRIPGSSSSAVNSTTRFIRSHSSSNIHKANAHHRVPKGGQSKPWYEIEGSDDEGSLLRVAKSSRSTSHSSNSSMPSNNASSSSTGESAGSDSSFPSNPEESSSQNESTEEGNQKEDDDNNCEITSGEQGPEDEEKETKVRQSESQLQTHQNSSSPSSPTYI